MRILMLSKALVVGAYQKKAEELAAKREKLEERHPELAGDRRPILAHEGIFARKPLRAGDDIAAAVRDASSPTQSDTHKDKQQQ